MKIFFLARGYPTPSYVRNGIFEFDQAKALRDIGHEVVYLSVDIRSIRRWRKWGLEEFDRDGIHYYNINIPIGKVNNRIKKPISEYFIKKIYSKAINDHGTPDIIHSHFINSGYYSVKLFKDLNIPLVHTEHYSKMNEKNINEYYKKMGKYVYSSVNNLISVSGALAQNIDENFSVKSTVIPNIVDTSIFNYGNDYYKKDDVFHFISVGNLVKSKRMDLLIQAFYNAFSINTNIKLHIYGDGPERAKLKQLIETKNLNNQIFLMGEVERKKIAYQMKKSHAFVLASETETFGVVFIEALASGLPVITTRSGGPEDIIDADNGLIVPINEIEPLSDALQIMYRNFSKYNKLKISQNARYKYGPKQIAKSIINEYNKVID